MTSSLLLLGILHCLIPGSLAAYCLAYYTSAGTISYYRYCQHGCCGSAYDRACCDSANTGAIIGGVIGALLVIAVIVSIIVCCVFAKKREQRKAKMLEIQAANADSTIQTVYTGHGYPSYHPPPNAMPPLDGPYQLQGGPIFPRGTEPVPPPQLDYHPPPPPLSPPPQYTAESGVQSEGATNQEPTPTD